MRRIGLKSLAGAALVLGGGLALAQTTPTAPQSSPPAATKPSETTTTKQNESKVTLTEAQAKSWIDRPVFTSDGKEIGEVAAFKRAADNTVLELHADIGGILGLGETRVSVTPAQFKLQTDRVDLTLTENQVKALPKVKN